MALPNEEPADSQPQECTFSGGLTITLLPHTPRIRRCVSDPCILPSAVGGFDQASQYPCRACGCHGAYYRKRARESEVELPGSTRPSCEQEDDTRESMTIPLPDIPVFRRCLSDPNLMPSADGGLDELLQSPPCSECGCTGRYYVKRSRKPEFESAERPPSAEEDHTRELPVTPSAVGFAEPNMALHSRHNASSGSHVPPQPSNLEQLAIFQEIDRVRN